MFSGPLIDILSIRVKLMEEPSTKIRAITFDFWRTLFYADSRLQERRQARVDAVVRLRGLPRDRVKEAMKFIDSESLRIHITEQRTVGPIEAIPMLERQLDISFEEDEGVALSEEWANALILHPPEPVEGALAAVRAAANQVPVGLISDTGIVPGSRIQKLLDRCGFLEHMTCLSFSDEVGAAKPQPAGFEHAAAGLEVAPEELLHIGDLEPTDVKGAQNFGAKAALFCGDNSRYLEGSRADYVFNRWDEFVDNLPRILD